MGGKKLIKRADGSYSPRGLWDNIRANIGSGKKPTKQMLEQESKIKNSQKMGGKRKLMKKAGFPDLSGDGKITKKDILMGRGVIGKGKKKKMYGGKKPKKKMMGGKQPMAMYEKGGFLSEPSVFDLDND